MAASWTYTTLKAAITGETEEQGAEFAAFLDTIIGLAETRVLKDLDLELWDVVTTGTFGVTGTAADRLVTRADDVLVVRSFHYITATGDRVLLDPRSYEFCVDYWPKFTTTTSTPKYYTAYSETQWMVVGTPAGGLSYEIRHMQRPAGLSGSVATTWLGTNVPDVLLWACMVESEQFLKADERIAVWTNRYADALRSALRELKPDQRDNYSPVTSTPVKEQ